MAGWSGAFLQGDGPSRDEAAHLRVGRIQPAGYLRLVQCSPPSPICGTQLLLRPSGNERTRELTLARSGPSCASCLTVPLEGRRRLAIL
jgi:hypothetical protein